MEEIEKGEAKPEDLDNLPLPRISYVGTHQVAAVLVLMRPYFLGLKYEVRQIMTRADFMDGMCDIPRCSFPCS